MTSLPSSPREYSSVAKLLHWTMALIWLSAWIIGYVGVTWREELNQNHGWTLAHKALASTILFLVVMRILWRMTHRVPSLPATMSPFMQKMAHFAHYLLYAVALIGLPLSGWVWSSVAGYPIMVLWLFQLPPLTSPHPEYYDMMKQIHVTTAYAMGIMVSGHILIALKHAFIDKDSVMKSMLLGKKHRLVKED